MKAYPLIYSRTKNFDFVPDFLARPKDLNCQLALKYVKNAMNNLDFVRGIRYTAFPVEQYCICGGIACISSKLIDNLKLLSPAFPSDYSDVAEYLRDCKGRQLACFVGIAIPKSEVKDGLIPDLSLKEYWDIYLQYLKKQWFNENNTSSEQLDDPPIEIREKRYTESFWPQKEIVGSRSIIKNYMSHEQQTLDYFFHAILSGNDESIITEIQSREEWNALNFKTAVVSESLYMALKENPTNVSNSRNSLSGGNISKEGREGDVSIKRTTFKEQKPDQDAKKKGSSSGMTPIIVAVLILIILMMILRRNL